MDCAKPDTVWYNTSNSLPPYHNTNFIFPGIGLQILTAIGSNGVTRKYQTVFSMENINFMNGIIRD